MEMVNIYKLFVMATNRKHYSQTLRIRIVQEIFRVKLMMMTMLLVLLLDGDDDDDDDEPQSHRAMRNMNSK